MSEQTAVQWLVEQLKGKCFIRVDEGVSLDIPKELIEKALSMEKDQTVEAYCKGAEMIQALNQYQAVGGTSRENE